MSDDSKLDFRDADHEISVTLNLSLPHRAEEDVLMLWLFQRANDQYIPVSSYGASWPLLGNEPQARVG
jgi:hypothetical protein